MVSFIAGGAVPEHASKSSEQGPKVFPDRDLGRHIDLRIYVGETGLHFFKLNVASSSHLLCRSQRRWGDHEGLVGKGPSGIQVGDGLIGSITPRGINARLLPIESHKVVLPDVHVVPWSTVLHNLIRDHLRLRHVNVHLERKPDIQPHHMRLERVVVKGQHLEVRRAGP